MLDFKGKLQLKCRRFMNNNQEHFVNDVLRTDWEYRINLPLWDKEPKRHELERLIQKFMVSTAKQKWTKGQLKILPLWVWCDWGIGVRQHLGSRAFRIAGGCPDALAR